MLCTLAHISGSCGISVPKNRTVRECTRLEDEDTTVNNSNNKNKKFHGTFMTNKFTSI